MEFIGFGIVVFIAALFVVALARRHGWADTIKVVSIPSGIVGFAFVVLADTTGGGVGFVEGLMVWPIAAGVIAPFVVIALAGIEVVVYLPDTLAYRRRQRQRERARLEHVVGK